MRYFVTIGGRTIEVDLTGQRPRLEGVEVEADLATVPGTELRHLRIDGASHPLSVRAGARRGSWELSLGGRQLEAEVVDERTRTIREMTGSQGVHAERTVTAPMPGLVIRVEVKVGDRVKAGQGVVIVEAMKMENELKAPGEGVVAKVSVEAGQTVEKGAILLVLES